MRTLHGLGNEETFRAAVELLRSDGPARRAVGADILGQLGRRPLNPRDRPKPLEELPYRAPAVEVLLEALAREGDPWVLYSIGYALGHLDDPRCIPALHKLRQHLDEDVRHSVVFGLLGHDDDLAVDTLVELSSDPDEDVRDWATFGLGTQLDRDTEQVRDALLVRLEDPTRERARRR